ncbi:solute:sodium symporter family transporter [Halalkalibacterium halodurans]|uniref:Na+/myo-inositol cotransporter n=1 Tax=Halalkalibacterium halodurans (strain ATCC BAA-125 / DSM 18197 / FERM 7344 / JCM 9153 / C-125) TaxID=272558 RepID=Q9KAR5_HALH5|nr:solute:sodium symporter family transporter [Halalkalibacterium halodurans]MED4080993.1 solute:sodium symporter family transporter [Halalkalibacterium halodurans]MED4085176.1 solute:sodium symporter family transporter [Halalkalibacterium halodurans]MED4105246.1 solute:sodium symporter family transporter [Halalkalibacterium halodurans]MED4109055.1 solute:sodium symporter family transporter [Halalkalibacterium halodurans]MED4123692.1 solute:sodium symporter family transporter [Halalkalibacteri
MIWIILASFLMYSIFVMWFSWYKTRGTDLSSSDGYFLGGRSLTGIVIASSLILTNLSTEQVVGLNGQAFGESMVVMAWEVTAPIALILMAFVFLPRYLKLGITTIPDFLEQRFDLRTRQIVSVLFLLGYATVFLPTVLYSGALVIDSIFSLSSVMDISPFMIVLCISIAIGIISCGYVILGGLKACAMSDTINGIGLIIGGLLIPILALFVLGRGDFASGVGELVSANPTKLNAIGNDQASVPWAVLLTGLLFNNLFYWCTNQSIIQRTLAAKNLAEGQKGVLFAGMFKIFGAAFLVLPGIIAYLLYGDVLANADMAYPSLVIDVMPVALSGFLAAVLFGAILSSFNNVLNSSITLFTLDIYKPIFKPNAKEPELVKAGRIFAACLAITAVVIAPFILYAPQGLYYFLQEMNGFYSLPIIAMVIVGFFSKYVPASAPKVLVAVHVVLYAGSKVVLGEVNFLYVLSVLFPINVLVMLIVGRLKPRETSFVLPTANKVDLTPWKYAKPFSAFILLTMLGVYTFFSPLGVAESSGGYTIYQFIFFIVTLAFIGGVVLFWKKTDRIRGGRVPLNQMYPFNQKSG